MPRVFTWPLGQIFLILIFLLTILFVSFVLRSKRPPGNTLAWLLFIVLVPYIGIPLYVLLADRKFQTRLRRKKTLYQPNPEEIPRQEGMVDKLLAGLGLPPAWPGQKARLILKGEDAYAEIVELIESARHRIHLTTFIFADDPVGRALTELLEKKAEQGVQVRLLLDSLGSFMVRHPSFKGLRSKGGQAVFFNPVIHMPLRGRANLRYHRKLLIVDSQKALLGGMNIAKEYIGPTPDPGRWIDLCLEAEGSCVRDMEAIFSEDWKFATGEKPGRETTEGPEAPGESNLQVIAAGPDVLWDPLYDTLISLIYQASKRIWIATPYFIPDDALNMALKLAARRGVDVRVLVPRKSNHFLADLARGTYLRDLLKSGCQTALVERMMHAKAVLVDGKYAILGSANFDMRSLLLNYEVGVMIRSGAPLEALEHWFQKQFQEAGKPESKVGYWRDLAEGLGRVLGPLI